MILETLSDFFLFLSTDKKTIVTKNLIDFDTFIESKFAYLDNKNSRFSSKNREYTQLSYSLHSLLNELLYYNYKNKKIILSPEQETSIQNRISIKLKKEENIELKETRNNKIKIEQTKVSLCSFLRNKELEINLDPINFISFFNSSNERHKQTVIKFMNIIKPYLEEKAKDLSEDNIPNKTADEIDRKSDLDKSNQNNKSGLSYLSEKERLIQNKEKFVSVLNKVKINLNMNNESNHRKNIVDIVHNKENEEIKIEDINIKEENKNEEKKENKVFKNKQNYNLNGNNNLNEVKEKIKEKNKNINDKINIPEIKNINQINTTTNTNLDKIDEKEIRKKRDRDDCKCCFIF